MDAAPNPNHEPAWKSAVAMKAADEPAEQAGSHLVTYQQRAAAIVDQLGHRPAHIQLRGQPPVPSRARSAVA